MELEAKLVNCVFTGKTYENKGETDHLNNLYKTFCANAEKEAVEKLDIYGKSELQRINQIKDFFEWIPVPDSYFARERLNISMIIS